MAQPDLNPLIDECMLADRPRLRRMLRGDRGRPPADPERLRRAIDDSRSRVAQRRSAVPRLEYPVDLPVAERRDEIRDAIAGAPVVVVCGETGSGKTTQLPKICLELGRGVFGAIGHTQPRRIAARSVAQRIASELHSKVGGLVGSKVRFGDETGPETLVKLMTDGLLLAETQSDRALRQYDTIIIDEAHERSLNIDFLIGYLRNLLPRRPDLKVIITSATIDPERFAEHFDGAPIVEVTGRTYPVEVLYRPLDVDDPALPDKTLDEAVLDTVDECARIDRSGGGAGDVLVFLPGEREIRDVAKALEERRLPGTEILPLYSRLSWAEQARVFATHRGRRIVLATNVAETSLTVPGIRYVIDSGFARISRYSARSRVQRLPVERISQASADQRKGRCGRVGPGVCLRLYAEEDFLTREEHTSPEIVRTNLASVVLQMKALRLGDVTSFPFMDPPDHRLVRDGYETLHELGAVDDDGELTDIGRKLARLPIDPRIGRMLLDADRENALAEMLVIAARLSIQDPRVRPHDRRDAADAAHEQFRDERSDFMSFLNLWTFYRDQERKLSRSRLRKMCVQLFLSHMRMREWEETYHQLRRLMAEMGHRAHTTSAEPDAIHRALLVGLISNVGRYKEAGEYEGGGGKRFNVFPGSGLFGAGSRPKWVIAAELVRTTKLYAHTCARIDPSWIEELAGHMLRRTYADPWWDAKTARVLANERVTLFGIEVVPKRARHYGPVDPVMARQLFIHHALVEGELITKGRFFKHNQELVERVRALQAKGRRTDLMADTSARFAFFDSRVPEDAYSGQRFEKWRRRAERDDPELLHLREQDMLTADVSDLGPDRYPDRVSIDRETVPMEYRFEPAASDDGATLSVPVELVGLIAEHEPDWIAPGLVEQRVEALLRAAPKELRKRFVPARDWARRCAEEMGSPELPLPVAVANTLGRLAGISIDPSIWSNASIPEHLRVNIRALDDRGAVVAESRDLNDLRRRLGAAGKLRVRAVRDSRHDRDGVRRWDFGELPKSVRVAHGGREIEAYPAILDDGSTVRVRVLTDREEARRQTGAGLRRLAFLSIGEAARSLVQEHPAHDRLAVRFATLGGAGALLTQLTELIVDRACFADARTPRDADAFEAAIDRGWNRLSEIGNRVIDLVEQITTFHQAIDLALEDPPPPRSWQRTVDDIDGQLGALLAPGFLLDTPERWLGQYPRYLKGVAARIDRLRRGGAAAVERDGERIAEIERYERAWRQRRDDHTLRGIVDPALVEFRWMVEEYRVSIFAQELGAAIRVSPQRLGKQWEATRS